MRAFFKDADGLTQGAWDAEIGSHQLHPAAAIAAGCAWLKAEHAKLVWARRGHTLRDDLLGLASASPARQRPLQR